MSDVGEHIPSLREYLDQSGVLVNGTEEEIKTVRQQYRKLYKTFHKRIQRKENREVGVLLSRSHEFVRIAAAAKKHKQSLPAFIKSATFAYLEKTFIVPDKNLIAKLAQLLSDCLNEVQQIAQSNGRHSFQLEEKCNAIEKRICSLENDMRQLFEFPVSIADAVRTAVMKDPTLRFKLLELLVNDIKD